MAAVYGVGLRLLAYSDCGFEYRRRHGCLSVVQCRVVQVEVSAPGRSLIQSSLTECGITGCDQM
jgi:hypothetical protein